MFTGIIQEIGKLKEVKFSGNRAKIFVLCKKLRQKNGDSVCVNGACLTVSKKLKDGFEADVVAETLSRTNLGEQKIGAALNLEPSLKIGDSLDGHFVTGHVDAVGKILKTGPKLTIQFPKSLKPFIAEKGSVTLNGVSLTITAVSKNTFSVALIPFTCSNTNLGAARIGDKINIEVDLIARYLYNFKKK